METHGKGGRSQTESPNAAINRLIAAMLRSRLHHLMPKRLMLLTFTGRKSGKLYITPVNCVRDGNIFWVMSYRRRIWWRNLRGGAPVTVRMGGRDRSGRAEAIAEDREAFAASLATYL